MSLSTEQCLAAITLHSTGLADAARGNLDARVEHCPDWSVGDLVWHVTEVHWFWRTIVDERPAEPPEQSRRPARVPDEALVDTFLDGARALVDTLRSADQTASCWTWAPGQQDVAFVTRHQVQEAAMHHFDAAHAAGVAWSMDEDVAFDAVEEFLTVSVSSAADPADPPRPALEGTLWFCPCVTRADFDVIVIADGAVPGTVAWHYEAPGEDADDWKAPVTGAHTNPVELLLWLYQRGWFHYVGRLEEPELVERFRALCFTD